MYYIINIFFKENSFCHSSPIPNITKQFENKNKMIKTTKYLKFQKYCLHMPLLDFKRLFSIYLTIGTYC